MNKETHVYPAAYADNPKVKFYYEGSLSDGTVFDSNWGEDEPIVVCIGAHEVIPGLEKVLDDMQVGETREFVVPPELAYGHRSKRNVQLTNLDLIKNGEELVLKEGDRIRVKSLANPLPVEGTVLKVYDKFVQIDFNHPLADEELHFRVEVVDRF